MALALHGASPGQVWPFVKLSYGLVQFLGSTSMDPATTGFTEAAADRAAAKSRGMKQKTCASGGSRHLVHRWPGFSQGWPLQNRAASPKSCPAIPSRTTRSKKCSKCPPLRTGSLRRPSSGALHLIPTTILRRGNARCGRIPPCPAELGCTGKVAPVPRWVHPSRRWEPAETSCC